MTKKTKSEKPFVHLHVHSEKSFKDGCSDFDALIAAAIENGQPALALTDHGTMYDAMGFYLKAKKAGIKPIIGCEVYMIPEGVSAQLRRSDDPDEQGDSDTVPYFHLVLLAKNEVGLFNLHKLCSIAGTKADGHFYYRPRLFRKDLEENSEGLICLSACIGGEVPKLILAGQLKEAKKCALWYQSVFGEDYYLEYQDHLDGSKAQQKVNDAIAKISSVTGIETVLTNDCHYAKRENYEDHKLLKCISYNEKFHNPVNYNKYFPNDSFYVKSSEEMFEIAMGIGDVDAYYRTSEIADKVTLEFDTSLHFPKADLTHPDKKGKRFKTAAGKLKYIVNRDKSVKYPPDYPRIDEVEPRIEKELADISRGQFPDYFLNVYDIIKYAKDNGILIGAGRGSGAGSIVANIINITDVDPLEFDLIWERFWNPGRCQFAEDGVTILHASPPDIDIDVPSNRRDEVFDFTKTHFGHDRVANICTFGTYKGRNLVRDGAKALDFDEDLMNQILKAMPYKGTPSLSDCFDNVDECIDLYNNNEEIAEFIDRILVIEGCSTNVSTHAAGVVITDDTLWKYCPTFEGKNGLTTQYPYETLEAIGCLKIDLLGHTAEQIIDEACMLIKERHGVEINPYNIPNDDEETYQLMQDLRMVGIPQLQSDWHIPIIQDVRPSHIEDVIALVTIIRPGSMDSGQTDKYREACLGNDVAPDVEELSPVVEKYNNCLIYQEQIMDLAKLLGGFTLEEADELRKVCAKSKYKDREAQLLSKLVDGMKEHNIPKSHCDKIIEIVKAFFGYSFNKAHAAGYGITSYRVAYLKTHYFLELTTAQLNAVIGNPDETAKFLDEVMFMGYDILSPDVNESSDVWTCTDEGIRIPLGSITGVGPSAVDAIVEERELKGEYTSFENFVARLPGKSVKATAIGNLICVGAFDSLGYTRKSLWEQCDDIVATIRDQKKKGSLKGNALFGDNNGGNKKSKSSIEDLGEFKLSDIQNDEKDMLGFVVSLSDDEKRVKIKQIKRRYEKLRSKNADSPRSKKPSSKKKAMLEKLRNKRKEIDSEPTSKDEDSSAETSAIKDSLKSKLKLSKKKEADSIPVSDGDVETDKPCLVVVIKDYSVMPEKLYSVMKRYAGDDLCVVFHVDTKGDNLLKVYTNYSVLNDDVLKSKLQKIVGKDNVFVF